MSIRIRVDDFPNTKGEPQHTLSAFREFHRTLGECIGGKRYLLGVIPKRCDPDDILFLRNETDCEIGMHGIYHDEEKLDLYRNEFPPYLSQRDVCRYLQESGQALDDAIGRQTTIYMPPRNRIDQRTLDVLVDAGFFAFTSGPETDKTIRTDVEEIHSHPLEICYGRTDELYQKNAHVRLMTLCEVNPTGRFVLTLHWTWETNIGLEHMKKFFAQIPKEHFIDFF